MLFKKIDDSISKNNIRIFYELYKHFDICSRNVGIVGSKKTFLKYIRNIRNTYNKFSSRMLIDSNGSLRYTIFVDDIEYTYIQINSVDDLEGKFFHKYI